MGSIPPDSLPGQPIGPESPIGQGATVSSNGHNITVKTATVHAADPAQQLSQGSTTEPKSSDVSILKADHVGEGVLTTGPDGAVAEPHALLPGHVSEKLEEPSVQGTTAKVENALEELKKSISNKSPQNGRLSVDPGLRKAIESPEKKIVDIKNFDVEGSEWNEEEEPSPVQDLEERSKPSDTIKGIEEDIRGRRKEAGEEVGKTEEEVVETKEEVVETKEEVVETKEEGGKKETLLNKYLKALKASLDEGNVSPKEKRLVEEAFIYCFEIGQDKSLSQEDKEAEMNERIKQTQGKLSPKAYKLLVAAVEQRFSMNLFVTEKEEKKVREKKNIIPNSSTTRRPLPLRKPSEPLDSKSLDDDDEQVTEEKIEATRDEKNLEQMEGERVNRSVKERKDNTTRQNNNIRNNKKIEKTEIKKQELRIDAEKN